MPAGAIARLVKSHNGKQDVNPEQPDAFKRREAALPPGPVPKWRFPAGSVTAVELDLRQV